MIKKVLIANRGEIAVRVIRACKELGIKTVAVHSEADANSIHVRLADEDVCIGPANSIKSYLNEKAIISAATITNADAIHPGYGFMAENTHFVEVCESTGIKFIGPSSATIHALGDKANAKAAMQKAGVTTVPGSKGVVRSIDEAFEITSKFGYPFIIKAVSGGGGRGMRIVRDDKELKSNFELARNEARTAFNDPDVYMEKYIVNPRHVEVQFMADSHGDVVHFGERDCSVQRRHQKLVEESPSPAIADNEEERKRLCGMVVKGISSVGYEGAGTMEFLRDADGTYYFMEVNTRIQVEHPVSEFVTGTDLIKEMLLVAMGEKISVKQKDVKVKGHSIECRINAEDPYHDFRPSPGIITDLFLPGGPNVRVDTHVYNGYAIPPYYDSMVAKLITHGRDRDEALAVMSRCLDEFVIEGVQTTIPFHKEVMKNPVFRSGDFNTGFLEENKIL